MNIAHLTLVEASNIESKLTRMQDLKHQIKVAQAEFDMLKGEVVADYFEKNPEYKTTRGLLLASYNLITVNRFQGKEFEKDHPDIYKLYMKEFSEPRFILK